MYTVQQNVWGAIVLGPYPGRLFLATDKTQQHNSAPAPVQMGDKGKGGEWTYL